MPFNVGPFEIILLFVFVAGIGLLVLQSKIKPPPAPKPRLADAPGDAALTESLDALIAAGWRIESETTDYVFLIRGQRVNHILHFLVGLFALGIWWLIWIVIAATGGEERKSIRKT